MFKALYLVLCLTVLTSAARCQSAHQDSLVKLARADARKFRLQDDVWKAHKRRLPVTSDYFKPTQSSTGNMALLTDSIYVKAYREAALKKNKHRRTPWHTVLVGGGIAAGLFVTMAAAIIIFVGPTMN
jgi:hypothetical protein